MAILLAHQALRDGDDSGAQTLLSNTRKDFRGWEWRYLERSVYDRIGVQWELHDRVRAIACLPAGASALTALWGAAARGAGRATSATVLDGHTDRVTSAAFSPDGARAVTASAGGTARVWDASTGAEVAALAGHRGGATAAAWSPDGARVLIASADGTARIYYGPAPPGDR
ncbi:MAG: hypothetical protein K2X87_23335 [Gemmataceae bacterium]|nr:hypothetical protein [Gemmataceae bacterium]